MVSQYIAAWTSNAAHRLARAQKAVADFEDQRDSALAALDALVKRAREVPIECDRGLVRFGAAAMLRDFDEAVLNLVSLDHFTGYVQLGEIEREFGREDRSWSPGSAGQDVAAELDRVARDVQLLSQSVSDFEANPVADPKAGHLPALLASARNAAAPPPIERSETPMFYVPPNRRSDKVKTALWVLGILFLFSLSGAGLFIVAFLGAAVYFAACFAITSQIDGEDAGAHRALVDEAESLKSRLVAVSDRTQVVLSRLLSDMEAKLDETARRAGQASVEILEACRAATPPLPGEQDLVFGPCAVSAVVAAMARPGYEPDLAAFAKAKAQIEQGRLVVDGVPRQPLANSVAHMPLRECDRLDIHVQPDEDASQVAMAVAAAALRASRAGRARFMFVEPGRLAEAYRVFGALNDSAATRLAERLYITHLSEMGSAVDALRTFVGRTKEAMTRRGDSSRRIDDGDDGGLFLQRAVIVLDDTQHGHWPEKDVRRLDEYFTEIEALAQVGAREGSVMLVRLSSPKSLPKPRATDRRVTAHAIAAGLTFEGHVFAFHPPSQSPAELGAECDAWAKKAKGMDSNLRQTALALDWSDSEASDSRYGLEVEIGRHGTDRPARLVLGREGGHHAICIGRTGSGKTNLFHVVISNLVRRYSPDELELYLLDFKEGVEFSVYAELSLPHCRAVAIDADRGFGLSVLTHLKRELNRRASIFKAAGVGITSLERYEVTTGLNMPRIVLLIDEFQVLLQPGERLAGAAPGAAAATLEDLVRRGRSFGLHVILGSQTLAGRELTAATLGQLAVRIVLPCSAPDAAALLGEQPVSNQLRGPGDAVVWLAGQGDVSDAHLAKIFAADLDDLPALAEASRHHASKDGRPAPVPFIFRGSGQTELAEVLPHLRKVKEELRDPGAGIVALGAPTAFGERPAAVLRNVRGRNLLFVHRADETRAEFLYSALESALLLDPDCSAALCDLEGSVSREGELPARLAAAFGPRVHLVAAADLAGKVEELAAGLGERKGGRMLLAIAGAGRSNLSRVPAFATLLKDGAERGVHVIATCDGVRNLEKLVDRNLIPEFGIRALGPASGGESQRMLEASDAETLTADHQYMCWDDTAPGRLTRLQVLTPSLAPAEAEPDLIAEATNV